MAEKKTPTPLSKEEYKEERAKDIEEKKWAETFLKSEDWKKLAAYITAQLPRTSPYLMETIAEVKAQGEYIKGLTFPESLLLTLIKKGEDAIDETKSNPDAE